MSGATLTFHYTDRTHTPRQLDGVFVGWTQPTGFDRMPHAAIDTGEDHWTYISWRELAEDTRAALPPLPPHQDTVMVPTTPRMDLNRGHDG